MPSQHSRDARTGFSLIEMAVIMVIVGIVVATIMPRILGSVGKDKARKAKFGLQETRDEIIGYAAVHGNLPAPDTTTVPGQILVPADLIGHNTDPWGERIHYIVAKNSSDEFLYAVNVNQGSNATQLDVEQHPDSNDSTVLSSTTDVAFILFSTGADRTQDVDDSGVTDGVGTFVHYPFGADLDGLDTTAGQNDDLVEFALLPYLQEKAEASSSSNVAPAGSDVSTANDIADFPQGGVAQGYGTVNLVTVDTEEKTISYDSTVTGGRAANCLWYAGDAAAGNCTDGLCELANGFRAYFEFTFAEPGEGFTFAAIKGTSSDTVENLCGCADEYLGFGGSRSDVSPSICGNGKTIPLNRVGVEFDVNRDAGASHGNDPNADHIALLCWNDRGTTEDDILHDQETLFTFSATATSDGPNPAAEPDGSSETFGINDTSPHRVRIELDKNATNYDIRVWVGDDISSDLTTSYLGTDPTPDLFHAEPSLYDVDEFRFGWTFSNSPTIETSVTITDFGIKFLP
ncbi:type II secretion system protein [Desulfocurvus sp. DL9XJH121]